MKFIAVLVVSLALACTSNQSSGAAKGATTGAVTGAAAGLVSALIFGGNAGEAAARGAVWAGTAGAVGGAMAGTEQDRREAEKAQAEAQRELDALRRRIGDDAFNGLAALAECKHEVALAFSRTAAASGKRDYELAAVWLEVLTYIDAHRDADAAALYPRLVERDKRTTSVAQAEEQARSTLEILRDYREEDGLPRVCP